MKLDCYICGDNIGCGVPASLIDKIGRVWCKKHFNNGVGKIEMIKNLRAFGATLARLGFPICHCGSKDGTNCDQRYHSNGFGLKEAKDYTERFFPNL